MNNWLLFLLKSTSVLSLLYVFFRILLRKDTVFNTNRIILVFTILASIIIPFIYLPHSFHYIDLVNLNPISLNNTILEKPIQANDISVTVHSSVPVSDPIQSTVISTEMIVLFVYLTGVIISLLLLIYNTCSVLLLFRKARKEDLNGINLMVVDDDIPAFSFNQYILISQHDYDSNSEAIITHELSHIKQGHFYDSLLMEFVKIIYWFNPLVYLMNKDMKEIHEFQADEKTLKSGVDVSKYQLLIIQKSVGHKKFALANSFNHCQIKNRITMMNKSKNTKVLSWKVATFLPVLAFLLMAFGREAEKAPAKVNVPETSITTSKVVQKEHEQFSQRIEIKRDGNYINNKRCSFEEISSQDKKWREASNDWIFLSIDKAVPLKRIDEVRAALKGSYWVVQSTIDSDDLVYFMGDVSKSAKFTQGKWNDWMKNQIVKLTKSKVGTYKIDYSFIIDKNGKVRDAHIIKGFDNHEFNAGLKKILTQIPDWEPAMRGSDNVSVYFKIGTRIATVLNIVEK